MENAANERTPLLTPRDTVDGGQNSKSQGAPANMPEAQRPGKGPCVYAKECPDARELIHAEAKDIVHHVILALNKVEQSAPQPSNQLDRGNAECQEVVAHTAATTSAVPTSAHPSKFSVYSPLLGVQSEIEKNNVNTLVDAVLGQLLERTEIRSLIDPLTIDEQIPIDDKGNNVSQIIVNGLTTIGRTADAIFTIMDDGTITVEAGLGLKKVDVSLKYHYGVSGCCCNLGGDVGAELDGATAKLKIKIKSFNPQLLSLDVDFGPPQIVKFTGASFAFNWLAKFIVNRVIVARKEEIRNEIITKASIKLSKVLSNLDLFALLRGKKIHL